MKDVINLSVGLVVRPESVDYVERAREFVEGAGRLAISTPIRKTMTDFA